MSKICPNCGKKATKRLYCDAACKAKLRRRVSHKISYSIVKGAKYGI